MENFIFCAVQELVSQQTDVAVTLVVSARPVAAPAPIPPVASAVAPSTSVSMA